MHQNLLLVNTNRPQLLSKFPLQTLGKIKGYAETNEFLPAKIVEMGLLPETHFTILYQAPFSGPLYIEFGVEKSRIALRKEEAEFIFVETVTITETSAAI